MDRRSFVPLALSPALSAMPVGTGKAEVALMTHADGPHLGSYIDALAKADDVGTVWLSDPSGETVDAVRKGVGAKLSPDGVYKSPRELLAARKPVLALITMEAALAPPAIDAALSAGCHVMAEKPACVRVSDFAPLAAKANARKRNLMLALANRADPVMAEAKRIVSAGLIGKVYGMDLHTIADQTRLTRPAYHKTWIAQKARAGGGHLIWLGIHWLDIAMFITGSKITDITGFSTNIGGQPIDTEDSAAVAFRFENGTLGNLTSGYYIDRGKHLFIKIWGSKGWVEINHGTANPLEWQSFDGPKPETRRYVPPKGPAQYNAFVAHATRAALGVEAPVVTPDESLHVLETIFAAYRAAESGKTQRISRR